MLPGFFSYQAPRMVPSDTAAALAIEKVLADWRRDYPLEVSAFMRHMRIVRAQNPDGKMWTQTRAYKHFGEIPPRVYWAVAHVLKCKDWICDLKLRNTFFELFTVGKFSRPGRQLQRSNA